MNTDIERGCLIPTAQAGVTGMVTALLVLALANVYNWADPGWLALGGGMAGALLLWLATVIRYHQAVAAEHKAWLPVPRKPDPTPAPDHVRIEFVSSRSKSSRTTQIVDLPASPAKLQRLANSVMTGTPFSESAWTGAGRPFSRSEFHQVRHEFLARGWAVWRNEDAPSQGVTLTKQGQAVMRYLGSPSPTPSVDRTQDDEQGLRARAYAQDFDLLDSEASS